MGGYKLHRTSNPVALFDNLKLAALVVLERVQQLLGRGGAIQIKRQLQPNHSQAGYR